MRDKVWCIGPVSLFNKNNLDKVQRGNKASIEEYECFMWLNSQQPGSVIYVCFGSLCNLLTSQLIELGVGFEASNRPFIWVLRGGGKSKDIEEWVVEDDFEERTKGRGLIIRGWAPQVLTLSLPAIGGFLTHCGWNSTLEGICAGTQMVTWPLFGDQFCNERVILDELKIGVKVGTEVTVRWGNEENVGILVKREAVTRAIERLMDEGEEVITTPLNAKCFIPSLYRDVESGLRIQLIEVQFPGEEAGLPKDCENVGMLPSLCSGVEFFLSTYQLLEPVQRLLEELKPNPSCIISDRCLTYTAEIARKLWSSKNRFEWLVLLFYAMLSLHIHFQYTLECKI
ncbi:hypothetical protein GH714_028965 [Hevea brasiliensis]|uniref:Anthocyanidin 3-O-glucosyltransferase n=1 Tax=Hevea brasiliensis TaxID=3981 RepID=A0A6A6M187_HEVBR|nr:hypothetical protein GH714_028965 [Hevea brasiliensis]